MNQPIFITLDMLQPTYPTKEHYDKCEAVYVKQRIKLNLRYIIHAVKYVEPHAPLFGCVYTQQAKSARELDEENFTKLCAVLDNFEYGGPSAHKET